MEAYTWTHTFHKIYDKAVDLYRGGNQDLDSYFDADELAALSSIGIKPINVYDLAEDFVKYDEPDWDSALLIVAARRDYFLYEQKGQSATTVTRSEELPPKTAEMDGIAWLPRIIAKAECFLHGGLCQEIMYSCGGDRNFLQSHGLHPADFLRAIWAAHGDQAKVLEFVRTAGK